MSYFDYFIILILLIGFILGFKDGLVRKIIGLLGVIVGLALAIQYSEVAGSYISPVFNNELYLAEIIAGILIFVLTIFTTSVIKRIVHPLDKVNRFLNQFMGGLTGALQMLFFISAFLLFLDIFNIPSKSTKDISVLYGEVYSLIPKTIDFIAGEKVESQLYIQNYIEAKDTASFVEEADSMLIIEGENDTPNNLR